MSPIPRLSLTDLTRSTAPLQNALAAHRLAVLTRHGKSAFAVVPISDLLQLLRIAEQAVGLVVRPDLLQVCAMLTTTQQTRLQRTPNGSSHV